MESIEVIIVWLFEIIHNKATIHNNNIHITHSNQPSTKILVYQSQPKDM